MMIDVRKQTARAAMKLELLTELEGHTECAWDIDWNPKEPLLASCSTDRTVQVWRYHFRPGSRDAENHLDGSQIGPEWIRVAHLQGAHKKTIRSVNWSPNGQMLATASFDATVAIYEREDSAATNGIREMADGEDIEQVNNSVDKFELASTLEGHENECKAAKFSPHGGILASCSRDKSVWIWEVQEDNDFECLSVLMEHTQDVKTLTWHPREELLASASYDDTIKLYRDDPDDDWYVTHNLTGHTSTVWSIDFSPDGRYLVSGSDDKTIRVWRRYTPDECSRRNLKATAKHAGFSGEAWACVSVLKGFFDRAVYSVSWSAAIAPLSKDEEIWDFDPSLGPQGLIAAAGGDGKICIFQLDEHAEDKVDSPSFHLVAAAEQAHGHYDINAVKWCKQPAVHGSSKQDTFMLASAGDDSLIKIWRLCLT